MKPVKWPWTDYQIRDIYFGAKDPVEQVFILAELCAKPPEIMLEKLLALKLIPSDEVKEAVLARIRGEPVNPPPEAEEELKRKEAERRAKDNERKRMWVLNNPEKAAESARRSWEKLKADPERLERRRAYKRQNYAERKKATSDTVHNSPAPRYEKEQLPRIYQPQNKQADSVTVKGLCGV